MRLLTDIVLQGAERFAEREAVTDRGGSRSYACLADEALRVAAWLRRKDVRAGERVMVRLPNGTAFLAAHFGVLLAGAISVPCEPDASERTIEAIRRSATPVAELGSNSIGRALAERRAPLAPVERNTNDLAVLLYTTGTTGRAKGVMLTHHNVLAALRNICDFLEYTPDDREVVTLPLSHSFGLGHVYCNLMKGGAAYVEPGLARVGRVLRTVDEWGATGFPGTPLGFEILMNRYEDLLRRHCARLRFAVINSAPLPPAQAARLQEMLPNLEIVVYYGLTEASRSTMVSLTRTGPAGYGTVGRAMPGVSLRIGEGDEILIAGPTVATGYWGDPEMTRQTFRDGWLHTGDRGSIDASGVLTVTGRLKDLINVGGYKVSPEEVEAALLEHDGVREAAAFGVGAVEAAVVGDPGLRAEDLAAHCLARLEVYKVPQRFHALSVLPRSNTGKLKRNEVAALARRAERAGA